MNELAILPYHAWLLSLRISLISYFRFMFQDYKLMGSDKNSAGIPGIIHSGFLILSHGFLCESAFILCAFVHTLVTSKWKQHLLLPLIVDDVVLIASCSISFDHLQPLDSSLTLGLSV